jgi:hypothetical protein
MKRLKRREREGGVRDVKGGRRGNVVSTTIEGQRRVTGGGEQRGIIIAFIPHER